jgi:hypothetical protein
MLAKTKQKFELKNISLKLARVNRRGKKVSWLLIHLLPNFQK